MALRCGQLAKKFQGVGVCYAKCEIIMKVMSRVAELNSHCGPEDTKQALRMPLHPPRAALAELRPETPSVPE